MSLLFRFKHWSILTICMLFYFFISSAVAQNQTSKVDEITAFKTALQQLSFNDVVEEYYKYRVVDSTKAATVIAYLRTNFINSDDENEVAETYITMASWQKKNDSLQSSLTSLNIAIEKLQSLDNKPLLFEAHNKKGVYLFENGENEVALENFLTAFQIARETNNIKDELSASNNIILIKIQAYDNLGAIDLYLENLKRIKASGDVALENKKFPIYLGLTKAYINLEKYQEASQYAHEGFELSKQKNIVAYQAYFTTFLGEIASNNGNYTEASASFKRAKELIDEAGGDKVLDIFLKLYLGKNFAAQNKHQEAIKVFLEGEQLLQKNEVDFLSIQELYVGLAKSYLALENIEQSSKYFEKAYEIDVKNDKTRAVINSRIMQDELGKLKEQITDLRTRSQQTKYYYAFGIGLLILVIIGLIMYYKKQQRNNKKLFQKLMLALEDKRLQEKNAVNTTIEDIAKSSVGDASKAPEIDETTAEILQKLEEFEANEMFLSNESTLVEVAKKLQTNTTYLSKVINTYKEKSFTAYLTDLRVDYAIERLSKDRKFRSYTIGAIAQEIGFKRSESFSKAFKIKTGLYPSYFIKELEKQ
ncbi:AraC-like DNA-binding protein [Kordia periserrulae]|uniref:AraC-like DNA-binding protein n=1 Tax=Kordia periserrulae TaxID=701523 RepID=A0A2T6BYI3_9FLAO|nr:AraC family transcriptional regulator [Kordia periserrulae]PTX61129.1 AraC-like DNA-binding protein [Kordia periserrulae]